MASTLLNVFSSEDINYLTQLPEVLEAKAKLSSSSVVYFHISLTPTIRNALLEKLGLNLPGSEIPMRWIKGDTVPHVDKGASEFENTYLVYLNDSPGDFVVGTDIYSITANSGYIFNEGLEHKTQNTGSVPRLLLGPMNEFAQPVGVVMTYIVYYDNYAAALAKDGTYIAVNYTNHNLGEVTNGNIGAYTSWRVGNVTFNISYPISTPTGVYNNGFDMATLSASGGASTTAFYVYSSAPCFLEGTQILCEVDGVDKYIPIESIVCGTLVKTSRDGYKKVELIGKGSIENPGTDERSQNRIYKCSPEAYPELKNPLYITGCHSILVDTFTEKQREETIKQLGKVFITDKKYRLMACIDERAEPWNSEGKCTIWHLALENPDVKMNYGIYAEGLLVESCSIDFLKNKSNMRNV